VALEISEISHDARCRTQQLVQAMTMLGLFQAELARILELQCADIASFSNAQMQLEPDTKTWRRAHHFIHLYQLLYQKLQGDGVTMRHWLRRRHPEFSQTPHLLLVDKDGLLAVVEYLQVADDINS